MGDSGAQELLRSDQPLRLAYCGRDGLPRVIPIGFLWKEGRLVVCTASTAPKVAALRERPKVAVTIDTGNTSATAKQLLIRGTAAIEIVDGVAPEYIEAAAKTLSDTDLGEFEAQVQAVFKQQARISITPEWARFYDFGAGKIPPFLRKLTEGDHDGAGATSG
ncbi:MAG TPA: pyridoxamine 5'-phosphate oxidase family protein [Solirubrobacterales bacterium]|nr:pyridoxamine 5'-phosphate oxidase family protein [Solirubrobacterales bacterium]